MYKFEILYDISEGRTPPCLRPMLAEFGIATWYNMRDQLIIRGLVLEH